MKWRERYKDPLSLVQPILAFIAGRRVQGHHVGVCGCRCVRVEQRFWYASGARCVHNKKRVRERFLEGLSKWKMRMVCIEKVLHAGYLDHAEFLTVCNGGHGRRPWSGGQQSLALQLVKKIELSSNTVAG